MTDFVIYRLCKDCGWRSSNRFPYDPVVKKTFKKFETDGEKSCPKCVNKTLSLGIEKVKKEFRVP